MRAIGLDLGSVRIGVSLSDSAGRLALPYETVRRGGSWEEDHRRIAELVAEAEAERVVVGLPLSMDGTDGPAAVRTRKEVEHLGRALRVPVETYDERLSTVSAQQALRAADVGSRRRREVVDATAAAVILQGWLDRRRGTAAETDET